MGFGFWDGDCPLVGNDVSAIRRAGIGVAVADGERSVFRALRFGGGVDGVDSVFVVSLPLFSGDFLFLVAALAAAEGAATTGVEATVRALSLADLRDAI